MFAGTAPVGDPHLVHPDGEGSISAALQDQVGRWLFVHVAQVVLAPFLAFAVLLLLRGIESLAATISRVALLFWLVFFSTYDALVGIASGVLVRQATASAGRSGRPSPRRPTSSSTATSAGTSRGSPSSRRWRGSRSHSEPQWALRGAGANWLTTAAAALSALFAFHYGYAAFVGLIALIVAAFLWERGGSVGGRPSGGCTDPVALPGALHHGPARRPLLLGALTGRRRPPGPRWAARTS